MSLRSDDASTLLATCRAVLTLLVAGAAVSSAQTLSWNAASGLLPWDPAIPTDQRFQVQGTSSQVSLVAGAMHVEDTVTEESVGISKTDLDPALLEGEWEFQAVVRMNSCDREGAWIDLGTQVNVHGAGRYVGVGIDEEGVGFVDIPSTSWVAGQKSFVDLSDAYHTFRCVKAGGQVSLYLDAIPTPVIELPFSAFPASAATYLVLGASSGIGTSDWDQLSYSFTASPWTDLGFALPGTNGAPKLVGEGSLVGGTPFALTLTNALGSATTYFVLGFTRIDVPFKGGVMVPALTPPNGLYVPLPVAPDGTLPIGATWPLGLPSGTSIYVQHWIVDPAGPFGFAASNAVSGTTP